MEFDLQATEIEGKDGEGQKSFDREKRNFEHPKGRPAESQRDRNRNGGQIFIVIRGPPSFVHAPSVDFMRRRSLGWT